MADSKWMTDGFGAKAYVPADQVDEWKPRGWSEGDAPAGDDWVWMQHEVHAGRAKFAAGAAGPWEALGWHPSEPPEPYDVTKDPTLVDVPTEAPPASPAGKPPKPSARAAASETKE